MPRNAFIVGAGFSSNAGLPLASNFGSELVNIRSLNLSGPSSRLASFLKRFIRDVFGHPTKAPATDWPSLEDVFTFVDLSANTGHHLGRTWSSSDLRTVRRAIIVRTIRMLSQSYEARKRRPDTTSRVLDRFFETLNLGDSSFLSMNWDTVIEDKVRQLRGVRNFDYGFDELGARFSGDDLRRVARSGASLQIIKPHGSFNWLYCDSCRVVHWLPAHQTLKVATLLFAARDWDVVARGSRPARRPATLEASCLRCDSRGLGTRLATFSYRAALDFPMYTLSWRSSERMLYEAENWVFIGYSLPAADYEFKLMLKRVQLTRQHPPAIYVVTKGGRSDQTADNYRRLFGRTALTALLEGGLDADAVTQLQTTGVLDS